MTEATRGVRAAGIRPATDRNIPPTTDMSISELAAHAELHAVADLAVFPLWGIASGHCACPVGEQCSSPGKHPITRNGLHDATTDLDTIRAWWDRHPNANIGLPAHANGYAIIDIDPRHGGMESFGRLHHFIEQRTGIDLLDTLAQNTGGGGLHLLYRSPENGIKNTANAFGADLPGLDTRGRGGYIVAWPSVHISGGQYEFDDWLKEPAAWPSLLDGLMSPPPRPAPVRTHTPAGDGHGYGQKALDGECETVAGTVEGGRNNQLVTSAYRLGQLIGGGHLDRGEAARALLAAALRTGLPDDSGTRGTIVRGLDAGRLNPRGPVAQ